MKNSESKDGPKQGIEGFIINVRGIKVIIDRDLATLYGTTTKRLNEQVKRNAKRFPADFMFQLTEAEKEEVVANCDHLLSLKFSNSLPYAFTEHGAIMAAAVLNTEAATTISVYIVRAFTAMRSLLHQYKEIERRLNSLEAHTDARFDAIYAALNTLMEEANEHQRKAIGFKQA